MGSKKTKNVAGEPQFTNRFNRGSIKRLELTNFMCVDKVTYDFHPRIKFVIGANGTGKFEESIMSSSNDDSNLLALHDKLIEGEALAKSGTSELEKMESQLNDLKNKRNRDEQTIQAFLAYQKKESEVLLIDHKKRQVAPKLAKVKSDRKTKELEEYEKLAKDQEEQDLGKIRAMIAKQRVQLEIRTRDIESRSINEGPYLMKKVKELQASENTIKDAIIKIKMGRNKVRQCKATAARSMMTIKTDVKEVRRLEEQHKQKLVRYEEKKDEWTKKRSKYKEHMDKKRDEKKELEDRVAHNKEKAENKRRVIENKLREQKSKKNFVAKRLQALY